MVVKRVAGNVVLPDVGPDFPAGPRRERINLDETKLPIAFEDCGIGASGTLVTTDRRNPGSQSAKYFA